MIGLYTMYAGRLQEPCGSKDVRAAEESVNVLGEPKAPVFYRLLPPPCLAGGRSIRPRPVNAHPVYALDITTPATRLTIRQTR